MTAILRISMGLGLATLAVLVLRDLHLIGVDGGIMMIPCKLTELFAGLWR